MEMHPGGLQTDLRPGFSVTLALKLSRIMSLSFAGTSCKTLQNGQESRGVYTEERGALMVS